MNGEPKLTTIDDLDAGRMLVCIDSDNVCNSIKTTPQEYMKWLRRYESGDECCLDRVMAFVQRRTYLGRRAEQMPSWDGARKISRGVAKGRLKEHDYWTATQLRKVSGMDVHTQENRSPGQSRDIQRLLRDEMIKRCVQSRQDASRQRIDSVLLCSGNSNFQTALQELKRHGIGTIVTSTRSCLAQRVATEADRVILLDGIFQVRPDGLIIS